MDSPSPRDVVASCTTKKRYGSEDRAREAALSAWRNRGVDLRIYHCPDCNGFHLTKQKAGPMQPFGMRPPEPSREMKARSRRRDRGRRRQWR